MELENDFELYNLYIGRFQPPHIGHMHIFQQSLSLGEKICIAIRNVKPDEKSPLSSLDVKKLWEKIYADNVNVKVIIIPNVKAVKYGRGVGYNVEEIVVEENIASISATQIRKDIFENKEEWKSKVSPIIWNDVKKLLS